MKARTQNVLVLLMCPPHLPQLPQVCFITNPIWVVKTRLQLQRRTLAQAAAAAAAPAAGGVPRQVLAGGAAAAAETCALEYRGFVHAFVQIARCEGLRGLYKGLLPSLLLVSLVPAQAAAWGIRGVPL